MNNSWVIGHTYTIAGTIIHGDERGRSIGFPTANIDIPANGPEDGVWAGTIQIHPEFDGPTYLTAVSIGTRPTYYSSGIRLLEAHIINFEGDLYGATAEVSLLHFIRGQAKFQDTKKLIEQINRDVSNVKDWANNLESSNLSNKKSKSDTSRGNNIRRTNPTINNEIDRVQLNKIRIQARGERRNEAIFNALDRRQPEVALTHEWLSEETGIPVQYLLWKYPDLGVLSQT